MEKLLRSCDVNTMYILIRNKKGKNLDCRCDEIFDDAVCDMETYSLTKYFIKFSLTGVRSIETRKT